MNAFQRVLANCPWMPVVGNHEYIWTSENLRYFNQTWGTSTWGFHNDTDPVSTTGFQPPKSTDVSGVGRSTATSALGFLLSTANHHGIARHGATPSPTSRYFSIDFGLVHIIALDLQAYFGFCRWCDAPGRQAQLEWLGRDLAAANSNRDKVPWIIMTSHFPLYCSNCPGNEVEVAFDASWSADQCEFQGHDSKCTVEGFPPTGLPQEATCVHLNQTRDALCQQTGKSSVQCQMADCTSVANRTWTGGNNTAFPGCGDCWCCEAVPPWTPPEIVADFEPLMLKYVIPLLPIFKMVTKNINLRRVFTQRR